MDPLELGILCGTALATSILSAVVGMAGGMVLLAVMLLFLPPLVAIPLHGVVQLVSNASRTWIQRRHVEPGILVWYGVLLLPMGFVGLWLARALPPAFTKLSIGLFVLLATHAPGWLLIGTHPEVVDPRRRFLLLGGVVGILNPTIGATGPLTAPFFLNLGLTRQSLIGTKAASQMLGHLAKVAVFGAAGFAFVGYARPLAILCAAVVVGTWVGSRLLERVSEPWFTRIYKLVLTLIAVRLVLWDGLDALGLR